MIRTKTTIVRKRLSSLRPSPENDVLYRPVDPRDPAIRALARDIKAHGIREPLIVTRDRFILSGHRRYVAAQLAGQVTVPCIIKPFRRGGMSADEYLTHLRQHNQQRDKSLDEKLREELTSVSPDRAYEAMIEQRLKSDATFEPIEIEGEKRRARISEAKLPMLMAVVAVLNAHREFLPISGRRIHYELCQNHRPLRNAADAESTYRNDRQSAKDLSDLLTRARLQGIIPWGAITDETRPRETWQAWSDPREFIAQELRLLLYGYHRRLMQSQPNHVEVIVEKNTTFGLVKRITERYCIPTMSGRGFSGIEPYHEIHERFVKSGKERLVLIVASDFDPEGEEIVHVAGRTLRDDFDVPFVEVVKAAVTPEQVARFGLPPNLEAKPSSSRYSRFVDRHGTAVYELEALTPEQLQAELTTVIDSVIDTDAFNAELSAEKQDAAYLAALRATVLDAIREIEK